MAPPVLKVKQLLKCVSPFFRMIYLLLLPVIACVFYP